MIIILIIIVVANICLLYVISRPEKKEANHLHKQTDEQTAAVEGAAWKVSGGAIFVVVVVVLTSLQCSFGTVCGAGADERWFCRAHGRYFLAFWSIEL